MVFQTIHIFKRTSITFPPFAPHQIQRYQVPNISFKAFHWTLRCLRYKGLCNLNQLQFTRDIIELEIQSATSWMNQFVIGIIHVSIVKEKTEKKAERLKDICCSYYVSQFRDQRLMFYPLRWCFNYNTQAYSNAFLFQVQAFIINIYVEDNV